MTAHRLIEAAFPLKQVPLNPVHGKHAHHSSGRMRENIRRYVRAHPAPTGLCRNAASWSLLPLGAPASRRHAREARDNEDAGGTPALPEAACGAGT